MLKKGKIILIINYFLVMIELQFDKEVHVN